VTAAPLPARDRWVARLVLLLLWAATMALFSRATALAGPIGLGVAAIAVGGSAALRRWRGSTLGPFVAAPGLGGLGALAVTAPSAPIAEFLGAVAGLGLLAWLAEDPRRVGGGFGRATPALLLVFLSVSIAWASAILLPAGEALVGVGAGLLVLATILLAVLLGRPDLIDREPPATA